MARGREGTFKLSRMRIAKLKERSWRVPEREQHVQGPFSRTEHGMMMGAQAAMCLGQRLKGRPWRRREETGIGNTWVHKTPP